MPSWSVLHILRIKSVCPEIGMVIIDNFYFLLIYNKVYGNAPAITKHMRAGYD
jgi:hypothetical protein